MPFRRANCHANFESNAARGSSSDENANPNISLSTSSCRDLPTKSSNDNILLCGRLESDKNASIPIPTSSSLPPTSSTLLSLALTSPPSSQSLSLVSCSPTTPLPPSSCLATLCRGVYNGNFGRALLFAGMTMQNTARQLIRWATEPDFGISSFITSGLSQSRIFCLPFYGMIMDRAPDPKLGYVFRVESCPGSCSTTAGGSKSKQHCDNCASSKGKNKKRVIQRLSLAPSSSRKRAGERSTIRNIANNPILADIEIRALRDDVRRLKREAAVRAVLDAEMSKHGLEVPNASSGKRIHKAIDIMDDTISDALENGGAPEGAEIWRLHAEHIRKVSENGGKGRGFKRITYHPLLLNWAIAFLARTSANVYNEVAKVMMLPNISHVYKKTAELITTDKDKAYTLHMNTIQRLSDRARESNWTQHQRIGVIAQDSANIKAGIEHDYITNELKGGDETHSIATLSTMFQSLARQVEDTANELNDDDDDGDVEQTATKKARHQNSILDELPLAREHLVFKWTSIDPDIKDSSVIVASVNVQKVTPSIITAVMTLLRDTLPSFDLDIGMATSDAAGCNWVSGDTLSTHTYREALPQEILDKYPMINFDVKCLAKDAVTDRWMIFVPDMPHLTKNIVTCLELSSTANSKRNLMYGKVPLNLGMVKEIWLSCGGGSGQLHSTKLTNHHFEKDAYSRMNVKLATQVTSASVVEMIRLAINDDGIKLSLRNKGMYNLLANFLERWNEVIDICNGREADNHNSPHTPTNAQQRQSFLLQTLKWLSIWKNVHDTRVKDEAATEFNFFADETWFCIQGLLLAHILIIQKYCVEKNERVNPRRINTDCVEWHFGNARQMVGGSSNRLSARQFDRADKKASTFIAAKATQTGNNASGAKELFPRHKKH